MFCSLVKTHTSLLIRDAFISESYTTACEIAEALPDCMVVCSAGVCSQLSAEKALTNTYPERLNIIRVLDKLKSDSKDGGHEYIDDTKRELKPFIQLDVNDPSLSMLTDFNDYALKKGKRAAKREINIQSARHRMALPECLEYVPDIGFRILSPLTNTIEILRRKAVLEYRDLFPVISYDMYCTINSISPNHLARKQQFTALLHTEAQRAQSSTVRGLGLFKEGDAYVLNCARGDRYVYHNGTIEFTTKIRPLGSERYIIAPIEAENDDPDVFTDRWGSKDFSEFKAIWKKTYDLDDSVAFSMLGFLVQSLYVTFSPCAPHMWLRGNMGSGKSFLLNMCGQLLGGFALVYNDVSSAGLSQVLNSGSCINSPFIGIDEVGCDTPYKTNMVHDLVQVSKNSFLGSKIKSLRGTQDQSGKVYYRAFCMVLSSVTDSLRDAQEVARYILMDMPGLKLAGDDFDEVLNRLKKLHDKFLRLALESAPHHRKAFGYINDNFNKKYKDTKYLGHKKAALCAVIAGCASILYVSKKSMSFNQACESAMKYCAKFVQDQITLHHEKLTGGDTIIDVIQRTYFTVGEIRGNIKTLCKEIPGEMLANYGIKMVKPKTGNTSGYNLLIDKTKYRLGRLLTNHKAIQAAVITNSLEQLLAAVSDLERVTVVPDGGKRWFKITNFVVGDE